MDDKKGWTANDVVTIINALGTVIVAIIAGCTNQKVDHVATENRAAIVQKTQEIRDDIANSEQKIDRIKETTTAVENRVEVIDQKLPMKKN